MMANRLRCSSAPQLFRAHIFYQSDRSVTKRRFVSKREMCRPIKRQNRQDDRMAEIILLMICSPQKSNIEKVVGKF